jgi:predicted DNA-binding transcriptional regulator AlpA
MPSLKTSERKPLPDNVIVRRKDGELYFGWKKTALDSKIASGEIPKPFPLSADGRACGWFGWQVNEYHAKIRANAEQWEETRAAKRARR